MIVGIDEVGRGAWAGPLCVGAVCLGDTDIRGLTDSKKLTKKRREVLTSQLKRSNARLGVGWVSAKVIDKIGMSKALRLAAVQALKQVDGADIDQIVIDGTIKLIDDPRVTTLKQADLLVPCVSAASIIAKVARDSYMTQLDKVFAAYMFSSHVGYGTALHAAALELHGATGLHRLSFAPLKDKQVETGVKQKVVTSGYLAETAATKYLESQGYEILERNWKTKWCEIDIVARKANELYFVEVKYRVRNAQGDGLAAITVTKQRQMRFAANFWLHAHKDADFKQAQLSAISLSGTDFKVDAWLESL